MRGRFLKPYLVQQLASVLVLLCTIYADSPQHLERLEAYLQAIQCLYCSGSKAIRGTNLCRSSDLGEWVSPVSFRSIRTSLVLAALVPACLYACGSTHEVLPARVVR